MKRGVSGVNAVICVDKPLGMSSHDVVNRVRRVFGEKRVGHAGTLDPAASGLLVVGIGQATRLLGSFSAERKGYEAKVAFGSETTTDDAEGEVTVSKDVPDRLASPELAAVLTASLVGSGMQVPPAYSAISVGGKRSYARARAGEEVVLDPRPYEVFEAELLDVSGAPASNDLVWNVRLLVSKGCYVRSIARDLGRSMGTAAHLCALRRISSGSVSLVGAVTLEALQEGGPDYAKEHFLDPTQALGLPRRVLSQRELERVAVGQSLAPGRGETGAPLKEGERVSLVRDGRLYGVWVVRQGRLCAEVNIPAGVEGVRS